MSRRELPYILRDLPDCPACGSVDIDHGRGTVRGKYGSKTQYAKCNDCGTAFRIVWDIPLGGNSENDPDRIPA